jgi:excinuclease ABC subunit C
MLPSFLNSDQIPHKPGVYVYKDKSSRVIYVGKAIDLYHRVSSYFARSHDSIKINALVSEIASLETIIVESELEALILEASLIKKYLPKFNVSLKDDKDYLYIIITKEVFPRVITARKQDLKSALKYFGPFPSSRTVKETLKSLRRVFPWCAYPSWRLVKGTQRPCFYYHLGQCPGPCVGKIDQKEYKKIINRLSRFLSGEKESLINELTKEMEQASKNQNFEEAGRIKKTLNGINYLTQANRTSLYLENHNFLADEKQKALEVLQDVLKLSKLPERIECYDISNIQGHESTGSMVVLTNGEIDKSQYRKFKIKMTGRPNDVGMHKEMMRRRLNHPDWQFPDLFIIDGGIGQVNGIAEVFKERGINIPLFGLAKRMEWLYAPDGRIVKLPKSHLASKLMQKIRDEAHRFAITYHRKLHRSAIMKV